MDTVTNQQITDAGLDDWRKLAQPLHARFAVPDYTAAARFITAVAEAAEAAGHHPDVRLSYGVVDLSVVSHDAGSVLTQKDLDLAAEISGIAAEHGLTADPSAVTQLELALDTAQQDRVAPFWAALLTGDRDNVVDDGSVVDPTGRVPALWFQSTEEHDGPHQRWHFDLWLAPEVVDERIAASVAAGGEVLRDQSEPTFTVLADADGNRVCICTSVGRGQ